MDVKLYSQSGVQNSLQVSSVYDVPQGDFDPGRVFLLKNITEEDLQVTIVPAAQDEQIVTTLQSGWNPELVKKVIGAPENSLQYGY